MEVLDTARITLPKGVQTSLALGYFDGVHLGHRGVLQAASEYAANHGLSLGVFTFALGQKPGVMGGALQTGAQRRRALAELSVEYCIEPPFASFRGLSPQDFFEQCLVGQYKCRALFCGDNFRFGVGRSGNTDILKALGAQNGVHVQTLPIALYKGQAISSSRIRAALQDGDIEEANAMLGRPYEIDFPVVHGRKLGSSLGFPTLNQVFPQELQAPKTGVYITRAFAGGKWWPSATGYGSRPTVNGKHVTCETFIPGFSGNLYDQSVRVQFHQYLAPTQKFPQKEDLRQAVAGWAQQALRYFGHASAN